MGGVAQVRVAQGPQEAHREAGRWSAAVPAVDPARLLRRLGCPPDARASIRFAEAARRGIAMAAQHAAPAACDRRVRIESLDHGVLRLGGGGVLRCAAFDHLLGECTEVVAFVVTVGEPVDALASSLFGRDPLASLFVHTAGQLMVEALVRELKSRLRAQLKDEDLALCRLLGPGYSYRTAPGARSRASWALEEQRELFALFGDCPLPVELLESAGMRPKLSRSGLFGVAPRRSSP
jgi:hypothetical protein